MYMFYSIFATVGTTGKIEARNEGWWSRDKNAFRASSVPPGCRQHVRDMIATGMDGKDNVKYNKVTLVVNDVSRYIMDKIQSRTEQR